MTKPVPKRAAKKGEWPNLIFIFLRKDKTNKKDFQFEKALKRDHHLWIVERLTHEREGGPTPLFEKN